MRRAFLSLLRCPYVSYLLYEFSNFSPRLCCWAPVAYAKLFSPHVLCVGRKCNGLIGTAKLLPVSVATAILYFLPGLAVRYHKYFYPRMCRALVAIAILFSPQVLGHCNTSPRACAGRYRQTFVPACTRRYWPTRRFSASSSAFFCAGSSFSAILLCW